MNLSIHGSFSIFGVLTDIALFLKFDQHVERDFFDEWDKRNVIRGINIFKTDFVRSGDACRWFQPNFEHIVVLRIRLIALKQIHYSLKDLSQKRSTTITLQPVIFILIPHIMPSCSSISSHDYKNFAASLRIYYGKDLWLRIMEPHL